MITVQQAGMDRWAAGLRRGSNYHLQRAASRIYRKAITDRLIIPAQSCQDCGRTGRIHGHHEDYAKPLDVIWLCPLCHSWWHRYAHRMAA